MLSVRAVKGLVEALEQVGVSRARLLRGSSVEPAELDADDVYVSRAEVHRLFELAMDLTGDPAFGLHWAERLCDRSFNPLSHIISHAPTLRQGLQSLVHYHRLASREPSFQISESTSKVTLRVLHVVDQSAQVQRFTAEMLVVGIYRVLQTFDPQARLDIVGFEYVAPAYRQEYVRVFGRGVRFGQPFTGIVFNRTLMAAVSPHKDEDVHNALKDIADRRMLRAVQRESFALRVRDVLAERAAETRHTDMGTVAQSLGLSVRSLRRRLVDEGTSYNAVVDQSLAAVAKRLLEIEELTIKEVAYKIGFANTTTFHRAFKRWTGMTPKTFRERPRIA